ncbi:MAG: hypothetical protein A3I66_04180 [Burkholderiales bacterium RIFCSPLOWO2_02_FULL_57_36]|nr:MAG: hypothetical protein A3I66_04180 [Burkholderiales bacterium RIFCSPLOWO2_02_FULL_57_36]
MIGFELFDTHAFAITRIFNNRNNSFDRSCYIYLWQQNAGAADIIQSADCMAPRCFNWLTGAVMDMNKCGNGLVINALQHHIKSQPWAYR